MADEDLNNILPELNSDTYTIVENLADQFETISEITVALFRINLLIIGLFVPVIATFMQDSQKISLIFNNGLTQVGFAVWLISMVATVSLHFYSRSNINNLFYPFANYISEDYSREELIFELSDSIEHQSKKSTNLNFVLTGCIIFSLSAVCFLALGTVQPFVDITPTSSLILLFTVLAVAVTFLLTVGVVKSGPSFGSLMTGLKAIHGETLVRTSFEDLTEKRKELVKAIADHMGKEEFARSQLNSAFSEETDDDTAIQTTTHLLNKLVEEDGYIVRSRSGGDNAFVLDTGADENRDEQITGVTASELAKIASQIQQRTNEDIPLEDVDFTDWGEVIARINESLGEPVLMIKSEPNLYRMPNYVYELVKSRDAETDEE